MQIKQEASEYLIVGAGVFGSSAALELRLSNPNATVTIVDRMPMPSKVAASSDLNKIIRADYGDIFYMKLALESQKEWRNNPIYKPHYHEVGMLYAEAKGMAQSFLQNYEKINHKHESELMITEEARKRWRGVFRQANWDGITECYFNPRSGWGSGDGALSSVLQAALDNGTTYKQASVLGLAFNSDGSCKGVRLEDGEEIQAQHTLVATGAWTPWFLADSAPERPDLHAGDRIITAGAIQCRAVFPEDQAAKLSDAPVIFNAQHHTEGESIPPNAEGALKFNYEVSFTNKHYHKESATEISVPPKAVSRTSWSQDVPSGLKEEIQTVVKHTYGDWIEGLAIKNYRMCWDAVTPNQDWIISPHPRCGNLFLATGGSFHSWKFFPSIGKLVVKMLNGELSEEQARRWAWDRSTDGGALPEYIPRRDLKEISGYVPPSGAESSAKL